MPVKARTLTGVALLTFAASASAATFTTSIGTPVGGPEGACSGRGTTQSSAPTAVAGQCASPGQLNANAAALFGHVGAGSSVFRSPGIPGPGFAISSFAQFQDLVTFSSTDPKALVANVAVNLRFSGDIVAVGSTGADARLSVSLAGAADSLGLTHSRVTANSFEIVEGILSPGISDVLLRSRSRPISLGERLFSMQISTFAFAGNAGSARADFGNSLEIPFGVDVFVLPPGVTANAGAWLVNNRRVDPNAVNPIPEPSAWALMIAGFGLVGASLRRRRSTVLA